MGAPLAKATAVPRSGARTCNGGGNDGKPPKGSKKPISPKCLLSESDITAAVAWRLDGISPGEIAVLAARLRPLAGDFREARPKVARLLADMHRPGDRRGAWSLGCAVLAHDARDRGDVVLSLLAGFEVVKALQQGRRGSHANRQAAPAFDALDALIAEHLGNHPRIDAEALFDHFATIGCAMHEVLVEFDQDQDALVCQLDPCDDKLRNVDRIEFGRRVHRAR
ncbi:MAG: hypothetical protein NT083_00340 [Rhodocyclales bacterium]|nr:hypothetical protein [Rhodocyclales bacterium]